MKVEKINIWDLPETTWKGITTNGVVMKNGLAVMGGGVALEAAKRFTDLPKQLGAGIEMAGNTVILFPDHCVFSFPTKHHFRDKSDIELIKKSARGLIAILDHSESVITPPVYLPFPGIGLGGLDEKTVLDALEGILDDRVILTKI